MMTPQEIYQITCIIKFSINSLASIYQDKQTQLFFHKFKKSNLCAYNNAYIQVIGDITMAGTAAQVAFKIFAPFTTCITKIEGATINDAEELDLVMLIYNLLEYSLKYCNTTGSLWFIPFKSFKCKTKQEGQQCCNLIF